MDMPQILLQLKENSTHKISEVLSYADCKTIVEYVQSLQDALKNMESSSRVIERSVCQNNNKILTITNHV